MTISFTTEVTVTIRSQRILDRFNSEFFENYPLPRDKVRIVAQDDREFLEKCLQEAGMAVILEGAAYIVVVGESA